MSISSTWLSSNSVDDIGGHSETTNGPRSQPIVTLLVAVAAIFVPLALTIFSLWIGDIEIASQTIFASFIGYDSQLASHVVIQNWRLPRAIADLLVGGSVAIAGAMMQSMTRNPLASPGIMGLSSGASFATMVAIVLLPTLGRPGMMTVGILGAALGALLVYGLGSLSRGGLTPVRLALTGVAVSTLLASIGNGLMIYFEMGDDVTLWNARGTENIQWEDIWVFLPIVAISVVASLVLAPSLNILSLGEDVATTLGQRTRRTKLAGSVIVMLLAGGAVAVAGPVGFVGLMVPHLVRLVMGNDQRWVIPGSALGGACLMLLADITARLAATPYRATVPVGVVTSLIGVPFFLCLACRKQRPGGRTL